MLIWYFNSLRIAMHEQAHIQLNIATLWCILTSVSRTCLINTRIYSVPCNIAQHLCNIIARLPPLVTLTLYV